jgi:hypothetical protein
MVKTVTTPTSGRNQDVADAAQERGAANAASSAAATASTAGQGSAGIKDGEARKAAVQSGPKGI